MRTPKKWLAVPLVTALGLTVSCGGSKKRSDDDESPERSGEVVPRVALKYYDADVSISDDGTKVGFVSGRSDELKLYKYALDGEPARVTDTSQDLGSEFDGTISPDGTLFALLTNKSGTTDIYVRDYDGTLTAEKVSETASSVESEVSFSPDSKMLAFVRRDANAVSGQVYITRITSGVTTATPTLVSSSSDNEESPTWISTGVTDSYKLVSRVKDSSGYTSKVMVRTFTVSGDTIGTVSSSTIKSDLAVQQRLALAGASNGIYFGAPNDLLGTSKRDAQIPSGSVTTTTSVKVRTRIRLLSSDGSTLTDFEPPGSDLAQLSLTTDGLRGAWSMKEAYSCEENKLAYGTTMLFYKNDSGTVSFERLIPVNGETFSLTSDVCTDSVDRKILGAVMSGSSTDTTQTVAYVTWTTGDSEVRLFVRNGTSTTFYKVSDNQRP